MLIFFILIFNALLIIFAYFIFLNHLKLNCFILVFIKVIAIFYHSIIE